MTDLFSPPKLPTRMLLASTLVVALATILLPPPWMRGTLLFHVVFSGGCMLVAAVTSPYFAEGSKWLVLLAVMALNVALFLLPALPVYFALRRRAPILASVLTFVLLYFYVCCLFLLFPASTVPNPYPVEPARTDTEQLR
jgi:hypothetical protein